VTPVSRFKFAWQWALSSEFGPKSATDRHVALVLSLYMRTDGLGAWPSQSTLAARSGLSARSVRDSLHRLVKGKWLSRVTRKPRRGRAAKGLGYDYAARLPRAISAMYWSGNAEAASLFHGRDPYKPRRTRATRPVKSNAEIGAPVIRNHVPPNSLEEQVKTHAYKKGFSTPPEEVEALRRAFGEIQ
jgi:hypothetical protein